MKITHRLRINVLHQRMRETKESFLLSLKQLVHRKKLNRYRISSSWPFPHYKVLIVMNAGIGNSVEATPLIQSIRIFWPKADITIFCPYGDLFDDWCVVNKIARSPKDLDGKSFTHTFVTYCSNIDGVRTSCNYGQVFRTKDLIGTIFLEPEREHNLKMLKELGYKGTNPSLYVSLLKPQAVIPADGFIICLVPGSKPEHMWRHKRWPYFDQLAKDLLREYSHSQLLVIGTKDDHIAIELLSSPRIVDLRGSLSLRETAWVLKNAHLAFGNDCGPMHIADAVQTPSIIIFGPSCEIKNGPMYKSIVATNAVKCSPCQYNGNMIACEKPICMTELKTDIVLKHAKNLLASIENDSMSGI